MAISWKVVLHCRVEPFLWFILVSGQVRSVTFTQLMQDKICKSQYNLTDEECRQLSKQDEDDANFDIKNSVIVTSSQFSMYYSALAFLPSIVVCLFLGSWCDNYKPGRKILLYLASIGTTLETIIIAYMAYDFHLDYKYMLLASIPSALGGGLGTCFTAIFSYIPATTPQSLRTIRFMLVEIACWLSNPVSILGGYLLNYNISHPIGANGQLLNYQLVFIVSLVSSVISLFWLIFLVNEKRDRFSLEKFDTERIPKDMHHKPRIPQIRPLSSITEEEDDRKNPIKLLFDCDNVRDLVRTATKPRENGARLQLWLIVCSMVFVLMANMAPMYVMFPFAERVYFWDSKEFSLYNSLAVLVNSFGILIATIILTRFLKVTDISLAIIGVIAHFCCYVVRGTFQKTYGFWASTLVGCIGGIAPVGLRSYLSKIIDKDELGKVFSLIASIDGSMPLLANFFFTMIFTQTIDTFPGAVFETTAALLFIPLSLLIFIDIFCRKSFDKIDSNMNDIRTLAKVNSHRIADELTYRTKGNRFQRQLTTEL